MRLHLRDLVGFELLAAPLVLLDGRELERTRFDQAGSRQLSREVFLGHPVDARALLDAVAQQAQVAIRLQRPTRALQALLRGDALERGGVCTRPGVGQPAQPLPLGLAQADALLDGRHGRFEAPEHVVELREVLRAVARGQETVGEFGHVLPALRVEPGRAVPCHVVRELPLVGQEFVLRRDCVRAGRHAARSLQGLRRARRFERGQSAGLRT